MKFTQEIIDARMVAYDEVCDHLEMAICDGKIENAQAKIVRKQIRSIADKWYAKVMKSLQDRSNK